MKFISRFWVHASVPERETQQLLQKLMNAPAEQITVTRMRSAQTHHQGHSHAHVKTGGTETDRRVQVSYSPFLYGKQSNSDCPL